MVTLTYSRTGRGEALVLLHPLGSSRHVWDPVRERLAGQFDVVAVDLPGFGESPPLPAQTEPTPAALALAVADTLDGLGIRRPHVVGNSLGGWIALELAKVRPVASITLLSPAGLWRRRTPLYPRVSLALSRWLTRHAEPVLRRLVGHAAGRVLVLGQTHGRPIRMSTERARAAVHALATSPGFDAAFTATLRRSYTPGPAIDVPVTVAFGGRDILLLARQSRRLDLLPPHTRQAHLPGCGHIPVADDPAAVAELIERTATRSPVTRPAGSHAAR